MDDGAPDGDGVSGNRFTADVDISRIEAFLNRLREMRVEAFHKKIEGLVRRSILAHQKQQIGIDGPYKSLSPLYAEWKEEHYPGAEILWAEGDMIASLQTVPSASELVAFFEDPKASFHMGDAPRHKIPRRDPLFLDAELIDKITDIAADHFSLSDENPVAA